MFLLSTGVFIPLTPGYVISNDSFPVPRGLAGELFCRVLGSRHALFTLGKVSIFKITCLALERWYCIFRPITYKRYFTRKRVFLYILAIWVSTCLLQINKFFGWKLSGTKCSNVKAPFGEKGTQAMIVIYSLIGFYFPCLITWASFAHITLLFKTSPMARCYGERQRAQQRALLRMCAVASITLTLCWLPAQTIYVLSPFGVTQIGSTLQRAGGILAMFNSCVNPLIYWMTNSEYRVGLCELFMNSNMKCFRKRSSKQSKRGSDYVFQSAFPRSNELNFEETAL
ncbi:allatostatin-A receptor-like [Orbicella faveolata]|uniref:allatostatin-A receptor-like n=1 Tax=Orbicella faveolata TaxID=48498 RepID=UPI0009E5D13D|nr:allatostatin-A receptor-like [Orbicella faveolata]